MDKSKIILVAVVLTFAIGTSICNDAVAGLLDVFHVRKAKKICEEQGTLVNKGPVRAEGYLLMRDKHSGYLFSQIVKELLEKRFTYFELSQQDGRQNGDIFEYALGKGTRYFRFYLAPIDSPACVGYRAEIGNAPSLILPELRALGLPDNLCIASERTDESISRYEMHIDSNYSENIGKAEGGAFDWTTHWSVRDRSSGEVVAEVGSSGYFSGGHGDGSYTCPNRDQIQLFETSVIQPISDPRLLEPIKWTEVDPVPFPVIFELKARVQAERESQSRMSGKAYLSNINPMEDNGRIRFHDLYRLDVINPGVGIRANVQQKSLGKGWIGFQHLRFEKGEIVFLGEAIGSPLHGKEVAVFRYDRNVKPIAAYRISLPDISFKGNVRYLVRDISITEASIDLTLSDVTTGPNGNGMRVLTDYVLTAPMK